MRLPPTPCRVCLTPCVFNKFSHLWQKKTFPRSSLALCLPGAFFYFLSVASALLAVPGTRRDRPDATDAVRRASHAADRAC